MPNCPVMRRVRQRFPAPMPHVSDGVSDALAAVCGERELAGRRVAVAVGSRGVSNGADVVKQVVQGLRERGAVPFVLAAMGSHGAGTVEGQVAALARVGVTAEFVGCPVEAGDTTQELVCEGTRVYINVRAVAADAVLVVGRVKVHTLLEGPVQSGLCKMLLVGLGHEAGAAAMHEAFTTAPFAALARNLVPGLCRQLGVLGGIALWESGSGLAGVEGVPADQLVEADARLLIAAERLRPRLPFEEIDLLLVDEIGKDISGTGMDVNVIGRKRLEIKSAPDELPRIRVIAVRGLSQGSGGNAMGIGRAELCLERAIQAMDREATYRNALTARRFEGGKMPMVFATDGDLLVAAERALGSPLKDARIVRIRNTSQLREFACSEALVEELQDQELIDVGPVSHALSLRADGMLAGF